MGKPLVVIADTDRDYVATLEYKFLELLGDNIELEIISDGAYYQTFVNHPITAELFIVEENLYTQDLKKHNINHLFVLSEEQSLEGNTEDLTATRVYKYMSIRELYNELTYMSTQAFLGYDESSRNTEVIAFYSAIGGSGKTTVSLALAECLASKHKRILYINTESVQDFGYYLKDSSGMPGDGYRALKGANVYMEVKSYIRKENFSYVPPLLMSLDARNLGFEVYETLVQDARDSGEYDYIIVDLESGYDIRKLNVLQYAEHVIMVVLQDAYATYKTQNLLDCMDMGDRERYLFVCNQYNDAIGNAYVQSKLQTMFPIKEYIEHSVSPLETMMQMAELEGVEKLSYVFI